MSSSFTPTRAALVTPVGRGAVACVSVAGPQAVAAVESLFHSSSGRRPAEQPLNRILFGSWATTGEEIIVVRRSESSIEVHCHGGAAAAEAILASLSAAGCTILPWQEFIAGEEPSRIRAAARIALAACATRRTATILLDQYRGALDKAIERVISQLHAGESAMAIAELRELSAWTSFGRHLTSPWRVVIAGPPNVGKSTLINALVGYERAIVFDQPGTTRDVVTAGVAIDGWPIELADTAGLRDGGDALEQSGAVRAREAIMSADLVILVLDVTQSGSPQNQNLVREHPGALVVYNKCDLLPANSAAPQIPAGFPTGLLASAKTGRNLSALCENISQRLVPRVPPAETAIAFTVEQSDAIQYALTDAQAGDFNEAIANLASLVAAKHPQ
jgi:tRNA modification GTPase